MREHCVDRLLRMILEFFLPSPVPKERKKAQEGP